MKMSLIDVLEKRSVVKKFSGGRQSESVRLLEGGVVAKAYDKSAKQVLGFTTEVANLKHLSGCNFVPKLIAVDEKKQIIYMSYMGQTLKEYTPAVKQQVRDRLRYLKHHYRISRTHNYGRYLPRPQNVAVNSVGLVNLIDFGLPWKIIEPSDVVPSTVAKVKLNVAPSIRAKLAKKLKRRKEKLFGLMSKK